jgi:hypothetical protein
VEASVGRKTVDTLERRPLHMVERLTLDIMVNLDNNLISASPTPKNLKKSLITRSLWLSRFWTWYKRRNKGGREGRRNQMRMARLVMR